MAGAWQESGPAEGPAAAGDRTSGPADPPERITRIAAQRGLGGLVDVRRELSTGGSLITGGGTAAVSIAGMWLLSLIPGATSAFSWVHSVVRIFVLMLFFAMVWGIVIAVRGLVVGSRACFLFEGGLVAKRRSGPIAVSWPEIAVLRTVYRRNQGSEGKIAGYRVEIGNGPSFVVPLVLVDGRDAFIDRIVERLRAHGRPIE